MGAVAAHVDHRHVGNESASPASHRPAVRPCAKPDVRDDRSEARGIRFELCERLGPAADLDDLKPCVCEGGFKEISDEGVVFDQKQCGGCRHAVLPKRRERTTVRSSVSQASTGRTELTILWQ